MSSISLHSTHLRWCVHWTGAVEDLFICKDFYLLEFHDSLYVCWDFFLAFVMIQLQRNCIWLVQLLWPKKNLKNSHLTSYHHHQEQDYKQQLLHLKLLHLKLLHHTLQNVVHPWASMIPCPLLIFRFARERILVVVKLNETRRTHHYTILFMWVVYLSGFTIIVLSYLIAFKFSLQRFPYIYVVHHPVICMSCSWDTVSKFT